MTPDEFDFWQKAYLAALAGTMAIPGGNLNDAGEVVELMAERGVFAYRAAKAKVKGDEQ
jgi:hypothetical protein